MKKSYKIFLSILFCFLFAMPFATSFLLQENSIEMSIENVEEAVPNTKNDADLIDDVKEQNIETTWETPTYKTYDDYFTDYNITAETITEEDLTGKGSATDPYVVHSTRGFLWLTNNALSGISLNSKYVELACDIILNDESFDENGTPSGGDGIAYQWEPKYKCTNLMFDGNGFSIKGLYINNEEKENAGLFMAETIASVKNINFENVYISASKNVSCLGYKVLIVENCKALSGFVYSKNNSVAAIINIAKEVKNCKNYIVVKGNSYNVAGIVVSADYVSNCENYGYIWAKSIQTGGIASSVNFEVENCTNYGDIESLNYHVGGIVSTSYKKSIIIKNCVNYGNIKQGSYKGGILGSVNYSSNVTVKNCINYGEGTQGQIVGYVFTYTDYVEIELVSCCAYAKTGYFFCYFSGGYKNLISKFIIENCIFMQSNRFIGFLVDEVEVIIRNTKIISYEENFYLVYSLGKSKLSIENVYIELKNENFKFQNQYIYYTKPEATLEVHSCVVKNAVDNYSHFYGSDFSGFYCDWKTGTIGLKVLSGKGFYQSEVTEQTLIDKGYIKKEI